MLGSIEVKVRWVLRLAITPLFVRFLMFYSVNESLTDEL